MPLLILLSYAVLSSVIGIALGQYEKQNRLGIERSYAASTLDKDLTSLMRDAQAMIGAPSPTRMQSMLINLEEYEAALDAMRHLTRNQSGLEAPLERLESTLPAIRRVVLSAARLEAERTPQTIQSQAQSLTRLDAQMREQIGVLSERLDEGPALSEAMANTLRLLSWVINILAALAAGLIVFRALRQQAHPVAAG